MRGQMIPSLFRRAAKRPPVACRLFFLSSLMLTPSVGLQAAPSEGPTTSPLSAADALDQVQRFYNQAKDFQARFHQRYHYKIYRRVKHSVGRVFFKKPGMMRWDYETPTQRLFVSDGETLWIYEPEEAQAFQRDLRRAQLPVSLRFLSGEGKLSDDFEVSLGEPLEAHPGLRNLLLKPKPHARGDYQRLQLLVEPESGEVRVSILTDGVGNRNEVIFREVVVNQGLPEAGFRFKIPDGVRLVQGEGE